MYKTTAKFVKKHPSWIPSVQRGWFEKRFAALIFFERKFRGRLQVFRTFVERNQPKQFQGWMKEIYYVQIFHRRGNSFELIQEKGDPQLRVIWEKQNPGKGSGPEHGSHHY